MLELRFVLEHPEIIKADLDRRGALDKIALVDKLVGLLNKEKKDKKELDSLRHKRNLITDEINQLKKEKKDFSHKIKEAKDLPKLIQEKEKEYEHMLQEIKQIRYSIPNVLHESVPMGKSEEDNVVLREVGEKRNFTFKPKSHVDLIEKLDLADIEKAGEIAGARFYYLKNELVMLDFALMKFAMDFLFKKSYALIQPPYVMRREPYEAVTDLKDFEDVMYKIEGEDLYLIATAEHPLAAMHMNEILDSEKLPIKLAGISPCFRKEAGAHGKDTKGIFRVHQFHKVEQFIFSKPGQSWQLHEELLQNAEALYQQLKLPYRIVNICTADIGSIAAKKYDLEVWMPAQNTYREVVSCSNCTSYQAVRLNTRFMDGENKEYVHTLNSTAIATSRTIVAILENYQNEDGSVTVPEVLVPYMNGITTIEKKK
jgi:seryl-tRNA synthetase